MDKKNRSKSCCSSAGKGIGCCKVESLISVDERGQMVLPKTTREKAGIRSGDKLAVVSWERGGKVCCLTLIKSENLAGMVKGMLGPIMLDVLKKQ